MIERRRELGCFGGRVAVAAAGAEAAREEMDSAMSLAAARLLWIHSRLTRFSTSSELSLLNADPRAEVPASRLLLSLAEAVSWAGELSGGLVDATCLDALEEAGYSDSIEPHGEPRPHAAPRTRPRPAVADPAALWRHVSVDRGAGSVRRPPGIRIDPAASQRAWRRSDRGLPGRPSTPIRWIARATSASVAHPRSTGWCWSAIPGTGIGGRAARDRGRRGHQRHHRARLARHLRATRPIT